MIKKVLIFLLILSNIGCDQISKNMVRAKVEPGAYVQLIEDTFILTNVENTGAAMGLGQHLPPFAKGLLLNMLPLLVLLFLCYRIFVKQQIEVWMGISFAFIIGGGIGNLIDRFRFGSVTDFFYLKSGFLKTGIFNMADVSVSIGALLLLFLVLFGRNRADLQAEKRP
ncbi:MAG: signal peptidase II [Flavobacteriaceae bacterium]|nr:signal peptidase II [Flavobacteriaceae bacterium]